MEKHRSTSAPEVSAPAAAGQRQRRPYAAPVLTEYGPVAKLTQMGTGSGADGGTDPDMRKTCL